MSNKDLPDIQCSEPHIKRGIRQVGVENVVVPFTLESKYGGFHSMTANVSMRTNLGANVKGISMSRLLLTLKKYLDLPLKQNMIYEILKDIAINIEAEESFIRFDFLMPINRKSAITDHEFPIYHKCRFEGHLVSEPYEGMPYSWKFFQGATIQYASYCPCSAELCNHLSREHGIIGFPHAQRSFADILIQGKTGHYIWLEDVIEAVEKSIKTIPYPIIKRPDEQEIARIAGGNPMFVEDAIRAISDELDSLEGVYDWHVKCSHEESIHTSEAIAINYKGIKNGFDFRYNL
jgi:GTP cyclohydrolase I